jgi:hypothetical protein
LRLDILNNAGSSDQAGENIWLGWRGEKFNLILYLQCLHISISISVCFGKELKKEKKDTRKG